MGRRTVHSWAQGQSFPSSPGKPGSLEGSHLLRAVVGQGGPGGQAPSPFSQHRHLHGPVATVLGLLHKERGVFAQLSLGRDASCKAWAANPALLPCELTQSCDSICLHGITGTGQDGEATFRQEGARSSDRSGGGEGVGGGEELGQGRPWPSLLGSSPALPLTHCVVSRGLTSPAGASVSSSVK